MSTALECKTLEILHFDDCADDRHAVETYLKQVYGDIAYTEESTLLNLEGYLTSPLVDYFDVIICDYCMPVVDAGQKLKFLADCNKEVIFYTCLSQRQFVENVRSKLGYIPFNFKFIQKATPDMFQNLTACIDKIVK